MVTDAKNFFNYFFCIVYMSGSWSALWLKWFFLVLICRRFAYRQGIGDLHDDTHSIGILAIFLGLVLNRSLIADWSALRLCICYKSKLFLGYSTEIDLGWDKLTWFEKSKLV